ncbi:OmpA family protein [Adlercreutzia sp. R21]|uniref:OmpA family protein n=1 Tax=Adlercreutzia wanghongyangiae TaxID=3111451 RepID=A0ABU6IF30_9ACTN|nr:OmpA family protein [Adlercreutzia sp. R21]MEC4175039.1 OmpA family protein [Adlercreutzia sp. R7]MEC4184213.1 OmpA family protein [Adlercreutzia sp. R21]
MTMCKEEKMNRGKKAKLVWGVLIFGLSLCIAGCSSSEPAEMDTSMEAAPARNLAIVYASRANSSGDLSVAEPYIKAAVENECYFVGVSSDGRPQSFSGSFELSQENGRRRNAEIHDNIESIKRMNWTAQSEESDLFAAICKANDQLGAVSGSGAPNLLIIIDSGVSTAGPINFIEESSRRALLDPEKFIAVLRENGDLAKFDNIDEVMWFGLGETSEPQGSLNKGTKAAMQELYRALFEAAGVTLPEEDNEMFKPGSGIGPADDLPLVTPVDMPRISLDEEGRPIRLGDNVEFNEKAHEGAFTFERNSSDLANADAARQALQDYVDQLTDFPELQITVNGYTDTAGNEEYNLELSKQRANTVKALLVDAGVSEGRITAVGMGESDTYQDDAQNRRVEIVFGE